MNARTVIILWSIAAVLGLAIIGIKFAQGSAQTTATQRGPGQTLFADFPATDAHELVITGSKGTVSLRRKESGWVVVERDDYPANTRTVNEFIRTLAELKITQGIEAGPSLAPRFGMDQKASKAAERGLTVTFKNSAGKEVATVSFGKNLDSQSSASPFGGGSVGRYVRNHDDESGIYAVSELFPTLSDDPKNWLDDRFVRVENIRSIKQTKPGSEDIDWQLTREDSSQEFSLANATDKETIDVAKVSPLKSLLSFARFDDVLPQSQLAERATPEEKRTVTIETFDHFIYTITYEPAKKNQQASIKEDTEDEPPADNQYLLTVSVKAEIEKERKKVEGETEEQAKEAQKVFDEKVKAQTEKLKNEQALSGRVFVVSQFTVESLLKSRADLLSQAPAASPAPAASNGNAAEATVPPGTSAYTDPIEVSLPEAQQQASDAEPQPSGE